MGRRSRACANASENETTLQMSIVATNADVDYRGGTIAIINGMVYRGLPTGAHLVVIGNEIRVNGKEQKVSTEDATPDSKVDGKFSDLRSVTADHASVGSGNLILPAGSSPADIQRALAKRFFQTSPAASSSSGRAT